jgi:phosphate transport system protein
MNPSLLDHELSLAKDELLLLGSMVEQAVLDSVAALKDQDLEKSKVILENGKTINSKRYEIERFTIAMIALQQPAARDLRRLTAIIDLSREVERIGDHAKGIAAIHLRFGGLGLTGLLKDVYHMSLKTVDMLHRSLTAFMLEDPDFAESISKEVSLVDELYLQLYNEVLDSVVDDPRTIERVNSILWVGHNLERVADRVTNICERVIFVATGKLGDAATQFTAFRYPVYDA